MGGVAKRDRRAEIMLAAEKLFTTRRFHEITLDDIVQKAGVGKGTVYRYFRNKEDLFFQTATGGFDELCELLTRKVPEEAPFDGQLLSACEQIGTFFRRRRQLFRMMQSEDARMHCHTGRLRRQWMQQRKKLVSAVAEVIEKGVREGAIRRDISSDVLSGFLLGMMRARFRGVGGPSSPMRSLELLVDLFCTGAQVQDGAAIAAGGGGARRQKAKKRRGGDKT